ncbi:MAG TPA: VOC family protein [Ilumatobacteraceae bacterium]|nr:VOC family protein [Ilumatobacteraceae bacterium]
MSIGTMRCVAINVTDFAVGYEFWSAVTGYEILGPEHGWHGWLGFLGTNEPRKHEMILVNTDAAPIHAEAPTHHQTNRVHIDITPNDGVDAAIERILELGGSVKKPPSLYPRPGSYGGDAPAIDWAVMQDPFGNEFCLVHDLTAEQSAAAMHAASRGATADHDLRAAAGQTARLDNDTD